MYLGKDYVYPIVIFLYFLLKVLFWIKEIPLGIMKILCKLPIFWVMALVFADSDVTEYCEQQCKHVCIPCQAPIKCKDDERDCGLKDPDPAFGGVCPAHSYCVKNTYNCNYM